MPSTPPGSSSSKPTADYVGRLYAALADLGDLIACMPRPQTLYTGIVHILERHVGALLVLVGEVEYDAGVWRRWAPESPLAGQEDIYPDSLPLALAGPEFWEGQIKVIPHIADAPGREAMRDAYVRHGIRAMAAVPVRCFGKVHAALILRSRDAEFFSSELLQLLERVALSMGHALEGDAQRSRLDQSLLLAERSQRALRLLSEALKAATHANTMDDLFSEACRVVVDVGGYPVCWLGLLVNTPAQAVELRGHAGRIAECYEAFKIHLAKQDFSMSLAAAVLQSGEPVVKRPREGGEAGWALTSRELGLGAVLALPLRIEGQIIGVIVAGAEPEDAFSSPEILIFEEMAQELSLGLERLRARTKQELAEQELKLNLRRFQAILASKHAGILVMSAEGCVQFCNATFCRLLEFSEDPGDLIGMPSAMLHQKTRAAFADPDGELERIRAIILRGEPVEVEEILISRGRTYLRSFAPITIDDQIYGRVWQLIDVTDIKTQEALVERLAYYDPVTERPNRRLFLELLEHERGQARRHQTSIAVGVVDLDGFKHVNDDLGHVGGDAVLKEVARRIGSVLNDAHVVARLGADEFAVLLADVGSDQDICSVSARLLEAIRQPMPWGDSVLHLSASIGWTLYPQDEADAEMLMRHADLAMHVAKDLGRDRSQLYSSSLELADAEQRQMKARLALALEDGSLVLLFQPIVAIDGTSGASPVVGVEALLRLRDEALGLMSPALFHHALDDARFARPIGRFALSAALRACEAWLAQGVRLPVSVNISTTHLMHTEFLADLDEALAAHPKIDATLLAIEITETGPLLDPARAKLVIDACRARGLSISLDDFGTGSASLSHVQQMDVGTLKIDQTFVRDILVEPRNIAIAAGILTTARLLGIAVIAEGVETEAQGQLLISLGCQRLQGYVIAQPMPAEALPGWITSWVAPASWRSGAAVAVADVTHP